MGKNVGLYIHIPFCVRKCPYCDFYSIAHDSELEEAYTKAVVADMRRYQDKGMTADSLYFGGGTPILFTAEHLALMIQTAREVFSLEGEITLEANPNSTTKEKLAALKAAGLNRISFGVQSADENELKALGRLHNLPQAIEAVNNAYAVGFENISVDIMLGTPYQTMESVENTLAVITKLPISHVSAYMLKVEEGTAYYQNDLLQFCVEDDILADIYLNTVLRLEEQSFFQYEISNFAKNGLVSRHNLKYWQCEEYLGFGASAHSFLEGCRYYNQNSVEGYLKEQGLCPITTDDHAGDMDEYIMLGLRLNEGIALDRVKEYAAVGFEEFMTVAQRFCKMGYAVVASNRLSLTKTGFLLSNQIISSLIETVI